MADGPGTHWAWNRTLSILKGENIAWVDFVKELEERFTHATSAHQARAEIHTLTQKGQIDQFLDHFEELKERSGIGNEAAMFLLERNIKGNIEDHQIEIHIRDQERPMEDKESQWRLTKYPLELVATTADALDIWQKTVKNPSERKEPVSIVEDRDM
ncbi:hypothetical protein AX17_007264 [Amanita inopinata Kibby_2008]|nr:hypothetical protein AX17_007264 [Amanita inopinata Kibby_2008]